MKKVQTALAAAMAALLSMVGVVHAQSWPQKPVRVLVNVAPGGVAFKLLAGQPNLLLTPSSKTVASPSVEGTLKNCAF